MIRYNFRMAKMIVREVVSNGIEIVLEWIASRPGSSGFSKLSKMFPVKGLQQRRDLWF